ncbi:hypothetical protein A2701_03890 [Candidatus Amesbacteria bacterium RIFCSPHIGHO2_01_FULL_47_34]|uniref:Uncharacterized protein n=2 Tax=Candidatus Amesiibacteriota TaxID=1752730 RepID=A0A1F4ZUA1_9BACT|nr:MAG: hypothetical protein A2972_01145 [Candidatus Amesbacteria bacterium RIFCSPLOWO2_01_FULL_47_33]OGD00818.1 MAG: hypothetical protein A2701_03890 [Candidatus Amesbacteria bacterium RIFCSPHIGHO2_01_FULL_47_34]OGD09999.1 MAG: hypothetical protein A2395_00070 [Candidatus Amesbacteria bacterium RIFOXYB1_FULL_47_9]
MTESLNGNGADPQKHFPEKKPVSCDKPKYKCTWPKGPCILDQYRRDFPELPIPKTISCRKITGNQA